VTPRWPQPDFLARAPRRPAIAWLWVSAAAVVAALAGADGVAAWGELAEQQQRLARATQRAPAGVPRPRGVASASSAAEADAIRSARNVVDRIAHPWDRILANIEAETPDGLQWLELAHDADDPGVRLEGTASDVASVLRFVDNLADHPGWSDVVLGRLRTAEGREVDASAPGWHFELQAAIDAPRIALARRAGER
jgi:hypothetical protein